MIEKQKMKEIRKTERREGNRTRAVETRRRSANRWERRGGKETIKKEIERCRQTD